MLDQEADQLPNASIAHADQHHVVGLRQGLAALEHLVGEDQALTRRN